LRGVSKDGHMHITILRDAAKGLLLRMTSVKVATYFPPAALIASASANLVCSTISSTNSSRLV
jgi:hypothetical protein